MCMKYRLKNHLSFAEILMQSEKCSAGFSKSCILLVLKRHDNLKKMIIKQLFDKS